MSESRDVEALAGELYASLGLFLRRIRQVAVGVGLSLPERSVLSRLDRKGPATAAALARAEQISPQAMGTTLSGLESRGLVERRPDPSDGRRIILSVSRSGIKLLQEKRDARAQYLADALGQGFSPAELDILKKAAPLVQRLGESL